MRGGSLGKAVACVFHLEGCGEGGKPHPPAPSSHIEIHLKLLQPLGPAVLDAHSCTNARVRRAPRQAHQPRAPRGLRAHLEPR